MNLGLSNLGKTTQYSKDYAPELLFPIARQIKRSEIGLEDAHLPFYGCDIWNHYEVSWLNSKGLPQVAIATLTIPATSPNIIESKSLKLYFNSLNNHKLANTKELIQLVERDLSQALGSKIVVELHELNTQSLQICHASGHCLDDLDILVGEYTVNPNYLQTSNSGIISEELHSNLLKSNCLVTNQPDWGSINISYTGLPISHEGLLKYIISFRNHNEFHEQCVERVFCDILTKCQPQSLMVSARFTRRGGIDINPMRSTSADFNLNNSRLIRQ